MRVPSAATRGKSDAERVAGVSCFFFSYPNRAILAARGGAGRHAACSMDARLDGWRPSIGPKGDRAGSGFDEVGPIEAVRHEEIGDVPGAEQRRDASRTALQRSGCLGGDPGIPDARPTVLVEAGDVEPERVRERPEIRQLLVTLAREQCAGERPEGALHGRGLGGVRGAAGRHPSRAKHEVA